MEVKKKYMSRPEWKRIVEREYRVIKLEEGDWIGKVSLLWIKKVTSPRLEQYHESFIKIVDDNYYWIQLALKGKKYWVTAMFDENMKIVQYYIDIIKSSDVSQDDPFFYDMFLDLVITGEEIVLLDEEELKQALNEGVISIEEYNEAYKTANSIMNDFKEFKTKLDYVCNKYLKILVRTIEKDNS